MRTDSAVGPAIGQVRHADDDIAWLDAVALARAYRSKSLSPVEVARALLTRIERINPAVNALVHIDRETTLAMARASEQRLLAGDGLGPIDGVPLTIKDLVAVKGWPLHRGSPALVNDPCPVEDGAPVARLREAGAVFLGKTATPDAGSKIVTRSLVHGVTRNPYDLSRTPGGSSGGASSALALGLGPLAVGTDGAGSIRVPAAWTGVVGLKPSFGRVPAFPPGIFMPHSVVGPMARTVDDTTLMLEAMSRPDGRDPYALPVPFDMARASRVDVNNLKVGFTTDFGLVSPMIEPAVSNAVQRAAVSLQEAGASVIEVAPTWPVDPFEPFMVLWEATYAGFLALYPPEKAARMDPDLVAIANRGQTIDILTYHKALSQRVALAAAAKALFNEFDLLLGPVMPTSPPLVDRDAPEGFEPDDWRWCPFTYLWNMTGQPAASVPVALDHLGLPVGVQIVGPVLGEPNVLRVARAIERASVGNVARPQAERWSQNSSPRPV